MPPPPNKVNKNDVKCSFELLYRDFRKLNLNLDAENNDRLRTKLKDLCYNYYNDYRFSNCKNILSAEEWSALNDLRNDHTIFLMKPDKGNGVVIMSKVDYYNKMNSILTDTTKFKRLDEDPTKSRETSLINFLLDLKKSNFIDEDEYKQMRPCGSNPGVMYGLPKVHKTGCPTRPIVSSIGAYNYKLAKFLVQLVQPLSKNEHSIKDTFTFAEWIQGHRIPGNNILCSFDVSSLFTNVPLDQTIEICLDKIAQQGTSTKKVEKALYLCDKKVSLSLQQ